MRRLRSTCALILSLMLAGGVCPGQEPAESPPQPGEAVVFRGPDGITQTGFWIGEEHGYVLLQTGDGEVLRVPGAWITVTRPGSQKAPGLQEHPAEHTDTAPERPPPEIEPGTPTPEASQPAAEKSPSLWRHRINLDLLNELQDQDTTAGDNNYRHTKREYRVEWRSEFSGPMNDLRLEPAFGYTREDDFTSKHQYTLDGFWDHKLPYRLYTHVETDSEYNAPTGNGGDFYILQNVAGLGVRIFDRERHSWRLGGGAVVFLHNRDFTLHEVGPALFTRWRVGLPWNLSFEGDAIYGRLDWVTQIRSLDARMELIKRFEGGITLTLRYNYDWTWLEDTLELRERSLRWLIGYEF